jgi:hypothetical protein
MKVRLDLIFPSHLVQQPVIYRMSKKFDVVFNFRRAKVTETAGEMALELEGEPAALAGAQAWLKAEGVRALPVTHDTVEG